MNILVLSNNLERASFRQRIGVYTEQLRANGINCEVASFPSGSLARRKLFQRVLKFDGVFLHKKRLNFFDAFWFRRYSRIVIYDFDDAVMYSPESPDRDSLSRFLPFRRTVKLADLVIAGNSYLAGHAGRFNTNVEILPTGLDIKAYRVEKKPQSDGRIRLVWIGSKSTLRYLAQIKPDLEQIGSRFDNVVLRIICDEFFDLRNIKVEKHLWSLGEQALDLATSDIGLAPLPDNRFTRGKCGFKILQYSAAALPIVASPVGVNAEYIQEGINGFFASNNSRWVENISRLINNTQLRKQMASAARSEVEKFDLKVLGKRLIELIKSLMKGSGA